MRSLTLLDRFCLKVDVALRTLTHQPKSRGKSYPVEKTEVNLSSRKNEKISGSLMRINHTGEICAQALYHGQSVAARDASLKAYLENAAIEEGDHLAWCKKRLEELQDRTSYLTGFWYCSSFTLGFLVGIVGDQFSASFLMETERQVVNHLESHLAKLPAEDLRSRNILLQMIEDEAAHRDGALDWGAKELPFLIRILMQQLSAIMVKTTYFF